MFEYDESILESKASIRTKLKQFKVERAESVQSNNFSSFNTASQSQISANLPRLNINKFSDDSSEFLEFFNCFESAIDSNEFVSSVDKFLYLKSYMSSEAYKTISGFKLNEENYKPCLILLKERDGKQDPLISCFVNKLLELEPDKFSSNIKWLGVYYKNENRIRNLQSMGNESDKFGCLLIPILFKQLPHALIEIFHKTKDPKVLADAN